MYISTSNTISPGRPFYDLLGSGESSNSILFIINMPTAISPSSTIFGTDFWVPTEVPMRVMQGRDNYSGPIRRDQVPGHLCHHLAKFIRLVTRTAQNRRHHLIRQKVVEREQRIQVRAHTPCAGFAFCSASSQRPNSESGGRFAGAWQFTCSGGIASGADNCESRIRSSYGKTIDAPHRPAASFHPKSKYTKSLQVEEPGPS
jgi:hypothetical protein